MRIFLSLFLLLYSFTTLAQCRFNSKAKGIVSLSGIATVIIKELGLLADPQLKGISVFNPVAENEFKGVIFPGGIFLSQQLLNDLSGRTVFYDESRDLKKILKTREQVNPIEIKTRNFTPVEVTEKALAVIGPYLEKCDDQIQKLKEELIQLQNELKIKLPQKTHVVFFLGEIKKKKLPELVIVQDGVMKWLIENNYIRTYPSELSYVNWSQKILSTLPENSMYVGLKDSARQMQKSVVKIDNKKMNVIFPGALVPGITQLRAFVYWVNNL